MSRLRTSSIRGVLLLVGLTGVLLGPWYLAPIVIVLLSVRYRSWEALALGFLMDLLWHPVGNGLLHSLPLFTLGALIIVWALEPLRTQLLASA